MWFRFKHYQAFQSSQQILPKIEQAKFSCESRKLVSKAVY